jgi:hypothetical protein
VLARQAEAHGEANQMEKLGREHPGLPDDLLNFATTRSPAPWRSAGPGQRRQDLRLQPVRNDEVLSFHPNPQGRSIKVVLDVDGAAFREIWLAAVEAAAG